MDTAQSVFQSSLETFSTQLTKKPKKLLINHSLFFLPLLAACSLLILLLSLILPSLFRWLTKLFRRSQPIRLEDDDGDDEELEEAAPPPEPTYMPSNGLGSDFRRHIRSLKDDSIIRLVLEILRLLSIAALLGLSIYAAIQAEPPKGFQDASGDVEAAKKHWGKKSKHHKSGHGFVWKQYSSLEWEEFGVCAFYTYSLFLAFIVLTLRPLTRMRWNLIAHLDIILLLAFCLYAYRDLYPLFTFTLSPTDLENPITWSRVGLLGFVAFLMPILRPRIYVPVDPANPTPKDQIAPEQVAPWLFYIFYEYLTPLVLKAWKVPSLPYDDIHPLADYDHSAYLYKIHTPILDPLKRKERGLKPRHLLLSLMWALRKELTVASIMCVISSVFELAGSVGTNQLLSYMEKNGEDFKYRPIVWVVLLFVGPVIGSLSIQFYVFIQTRGLVRMESVLTQLVFDHSLRLRMKESTGGDEEEKSDGEENGQATGPLISIEEVVDHAPGMPEDLVHGDAPVEEEIVALELDNAAHSNGLSESNDSTEVGSSEGSRKGKAVDRKAQADKEAEQAKSQGIAGKINVLIAADVPAVLEGRDLPVVFVYAPLQLCLCTYFLYKILSWSSLIGILTLMLTMPLPGWVISKNAQYQQKRMAATDQRVDSITEAVGALRMIKMFGWEERIKQRVAIKRESELKLIWQRRLMALTNTILETVLPTLTMAVTFACYTAVQKRELTAATVFSSMTVFELIKGQMGICIFMTNDFVTAWVSVGRINKFLQTSELIDEFTEGHKAQTTMPELLEAQQERLIRIKNATFTWGSPKGDATPGFNLHVPDITFAKGKINLITGPTGSGKSSLLKSLVGELHMIPNQGSFYHLPREGGVSYAAQESWLLSETLKDNILFAEPYEEERYKAVLEACALEADLELLDDGDETEIGEKGVTLSGGQKARVTLARAVYSPTEVVLLDDIFSALDTLTARWILDHLFRGNLMKGRTVLLITHHVGFAAPIADYLVTLDEDGTVISAGPIESQTHMIPKEEQETAAKVEESKEQSKEDIPPAEKKEDKKTASKLIQAEEKSEGRISRKALYSFFRTFGGPVFWLGYVFLLVGGQAVTTFQTYWLGQWARAYDEAFDWRSVSIGFWLGMYLVYVVVGVVLLNASAILYYVGAIKASRDIHRRLVDSIFGAFTRFLDVTPVGRIISRFTKDMKSIDGSFTETAAMFADLSVSMMIKFIIVISLVPIFSIPAVFIGALGGFLGELYIHSQLSVKREMSNAKSPLFSHFSAAVNGIVSIRAFGAQDKLRKEAQKRADKYSRAGRAFYNLNRWVTVRIDMLGGLFASLLAAFLVYGPRLNASTAGFALSQAISFSAMILWWVRILNQLEVEGNSIERIEDYLVIDQEPVSVPDKQPPAVWPTSGSVVFEDLSAKYSKDGPTVLDKLNVEIKSGEKVGIVGRTGSGKSTLSLTMLRLIPTTGNIIVDGRKIDEINLHALRSNVTIIPQDPILLSGSLRFNLDPFGDHDDAVLNDALQSSGLGSVSRSESGTATPQRLTLDFQVAAGGNNLSQGQRQLVALARALVRASKVLILDEATASVDFETDTLIQKSIRNLPSSTTVLTVAHRLSTVMDYDKILVLGAGKLLEFDSPENLKKDKDSYFAKLVQAMEA